MSFFHSQLNLPSKEVGGAYRDVGEGRAHHEVEDPGLQLDNIGGRKLCPNCGQDEEEDRREEGEKGLVQAVVFQRVTAICSEKQEKRRRNSERCENKPRGQDAMWKVDSLQYVVETHGQSHSEGAG